MMRTLFYIIICLSQIAAVTVMAAIGGFAVDVNVFRGAEETPLVEIVWSVNRGNLAFTRLDEVWADTMLFDIEVFMNDEIADSATLMRIIEIPRGEMITRDFLLFDKWTTTLGEGDYLLVLTATDVGDTDRESTEVAFTVRPFGEELWLSDIALLSEVTMNPQGGVFNVGDLKMLPNPAGVFGISFPTMYAYFEVSGALTGDTLEVAFSVSRPDGEIAKEFDKIKVAVSGRTTPVLNGFGVLGFPEGEYSLLVEVRANNSKLMAKAEKEFSVSKSRPKPQSPVAEIDTNNILRESQYVSYLLTTNERRIFDNQSMDAKVEFLERWWSERDPNPRTPQNEFREEILSRWHYADGAFAEGGQSEGWQTDRGRIFILHGPPDNIERSDFAIQSNPWEQWQYFNLQGGVFFVFADERGIGRYRLVHSTAQGELFDPSWLKKLTDPHGTSREVEIR